MSNGPGLHVARPWATKSRADAAAFRPSRAGKTLAAATTAPPTSTSSEPQTEELEQLRQEKIALEQALQEEKAKPPVRVSAPTPNTSELESRLAALTQERDQLLGEKEAWTNKLNSETTEVKAEWENEKVYLVKGCDEALLQAKVAREEAEKLKDAKCGRNVE